jgi:hypothetical protein
LDQEQVQEAKVLFDEYVGKGWKPYAIDKYGNMGKRIRRFDSSLEEIVFDDNSTYPLKKFGERFKEVKMMPRTFPG